MVTPIKKFSDATRSTWSKIKKRWRRGVEGSSLIDTCLIDKPHKYLQTRTLKHIPKVFRQSQLPTYISKYLNIWIINPSFQCKFPSSVIIYYLSTYVFRLQHTQGARLAANEGEHGFEGTGKEKPVRARSPAHIKRQSAVKRKVI